MRKLDARQLAREKSLFRYSSALERADFSAVEAVLNEAEHDPLLAQMIAEVNLVYESETFRLSPSLNHSSNHKQKDHLMTMTTLVLPNRQRNMQRWLPLTLAAACVSVLFIGALVLHPIRPNNIQSGVQVQASATPTAAATATIVPTLTVVPQVAQTNAQPVTAAGGVTCNSKDAVILSPSSNSVVVGTVDVAGIATVPNFGSYKLEIIGLGTGGKYISMADGTQAVVSAGQLGQLNLSSFPPDNYGLRLSVFDSTQQLQGSCLVNFTLARAAAVPNAVVSGNTAVTAIPVNVLPITGVVTTGTFARTSPTTNGALGLTLTAGVVVNIDSQSADGKWSHVVLDGGKNGWVLTNVLQLDTANIQAAAVAVPSSSTASKGRVTLLSTLHDQPNLNAKAVGTVAYASVVTINNTSVDGLWKHVITEEGTQGWMFASQVQTLGGMIGIVSVEQSVLRDQPDANARMIRTLQHNTTLTVTETSTDGQWVNIILPDGTQGWLPVSEVQTEATLQVAQPAMLCWGMIGAQAAQVYSRPVISGSGVAIDTLKAQTQVVIYDVDNQSSNASAWYYIQGESDGKTVQGWVVDKAFAERNYCSLPSSPPNQFTVFVPTPVPDANAQHIIIVPPDTTAATFPATGSQAQTVAPVAVQPVFSIAGTPVCISAITMDGTTAHVTNQTDKAATIFAAPLTSNSNASVEGEFAAKSEATLLYQQYDQQSAPEGALWYLIMTNNTGDKQVTGWVSANSITSETGCSSEAGMTSGTTAAISPAQLEPITGVAVTGSTQIGTCHIINLSPAPATLFTAPLTSDGNAPVVGTLPAHGDGVVIFQNYDAQSAPIGALWYLVTTSGDQQITGWVSANSINSSSPCAPEQLTGVTLSAGTLAQVQSNAIPVPSVADSAQATSCHVTNQTDKAAPLFAAPLTSNSDATVFGEFPARSDAVVIQAYSDGQSDPLGGWWYLITTSGDRQLTGWVSANSINSLDGCATQMLGTLMATPTIPPILAVQGSAVTAQAANDSAPTGICQVVNQQRESIPVYSGPSSKGDESALVNNLTPNVPAAVLYQQRNPATGEVWYLVLAIADQGKQISGWVAADTVTAVDGCPTLP